MPLLISRSVTDAEPAAGPMVHTILIRLFKNLGCFIVSVSFIVVILPGFPVPAFTHNLEPAVLVTHFDLSGIINYRSSPGENMQQISEARV
jgi:hypothetical protein